MEIKNEIAGRARGVAASLTRAISAKAPRMQDEGTRVINFTVGEPDFNTPEYITAAARRAIAEGKTKYTASAGVLPLRAAICDKLRRDNGLTYTPDQVVVANGAKQAIFNVTQALIDEGDEVIIPAPYWLTYPELVKLAGGVPVFVATTAAGGFKMTPKMLQSALTPKTKAVILNSPNNPTGAVYSESELRGLAAVIEKAGIWVISDEIYENLRYGGTTHYSVARYSPALYRRTVVINGMSKTFAMTGWRVGYSACDRELARAIDNMQSHVISNVNTVTQYAALTALTGAEGAEFLQGMVKTFDERRKYMIERLKKMPRISITEPEGAFYVMVDVQGIYQKVKGISHAHAVAEDLLDKARIAVVPGEAFGAPNYIRLSYTLSMENIREGLDALEKYLSDLDIRR
jgi:aspartate aminotransferase